MAYINKNSKQEKIESQQLKPTRGRPRKIALTGVGDYNPLESCIGEGETVQVSPRSVQGVRVMREKLTCKGETVDISNLLYKPVPVPVPVPEIDNLVQSENLKNINEVSKGSLLVDSIQFKNGENTLSIHLVKKTNRIFCVQIFLNHDIEIRPVTYGGNYAANSFWNYLKGQIK